MLPYIDRHIAQGGRLHQVTRHMLGLFWERAKACPGARQLRAGAEISVAVRRGAFWAIPALQVKRAIVIGMRIFGTAVG